MINKTDTTNYTGGIPAYRQRLRRELERIRDELDETELALLDTLEPSEATAYANRRRSLLERAEDIRDELGILHLR